MAADDTAGGAGFSRRSIMQLTGAALALPAVPIEQRYVENWRVSFTPKFVDLVRNTTTTTGTGNFVLGPAVNGFTSFAEAVQPGDSFYYSAIGMDKPAEREVGRGTMQADGTISREAIGGELTDFSLGAKTLALVTAAEWFEKVQAGATGTAGAAVAADRQALRALNTSVAAAMLQESGREGLFLFDSSDLAARVAADSAQALHVAPASDPSGASGAWVRAFSGGVDPRWFGIVANDSSTAAKAANAAALNAMLSLLKATANAFSHPLYKGSTKVLWPAGNFYFASPNRYFSIKHSVRFEGQAGMAAGGPATCLYFDRGGFRVEGPDTNNGTVEGVTTSGGGSCFRHLYLASLQPRPAAGVYNAEATSGLLIYAQATVEFCWIEDFTLDGITLMGASGTDSVKVPYAGTTTNCNTSTINHNHCRYNGRHGIYLEGADANACSLVGNNCQINNNWGIYDSSFLGNHHAGHHTAANGVKTSAAKHDGLTSTVCYPAVGGTIYTVAPGKAAAASSTEPGTDPSVWVALRDGAGASAPNAEAPLWVSGTTYKEGGSYYYDGIGGAFFVNCYAEGFQGQPYMGQSGVMLGGTWEKHPLGVGNYVNPSAVGLMIDGRLASSGSLTLTGLNTTHQFGPTSGVGADVNVKFNVVGNGGQKLTFDRYDTAGVWQNELGYLWAVTGVGLFISGGPTIALRSGGTTIAELTATGFNLLAGKKLFAGGTEVPITNTAASKLIGRGSAGAGVAEEITLGAGLSMNGTTLNATAASGGWSETTLSADVFAPNNVLFADISDGANAFVYTPPANSNFELQAVMLLETATATNLPRLGVHVDAQGPGAFGAVQIDQTGATTSARVTSDGSFTTGAIDVQMPGGGFATANTPYMACVTVRGRTGATPAPIRLQLACETASSNTCKVRQGSQMRTKAS